MTDEPVPAHEAASTTRMAIDWWRVLGLRALGGCVVTLLVLIVVAFVVVFAWFIPASKAAQLRNTCEGNLARLGDLYCMRVEYGGERPTRSGAALWLGYRKLGRLKRGDERTLLCPSDGAMRCPESDEDRTAWDNVDLDRAPRRLCSYSGRDFARFPLDAASKREPIGACIGHSGGAVVLFADGAYEWLTLEKLGLDSDDEKIVGPESKSPVLRVLRYGDGSVR